MPCVSFGKRSRDSSVVGQGSSQGIIGHSYETDDSNLELSSLSKILKVSDENKETIDITDVELSQQLEIQKVSENSKQSISNDELETIDVRRVNSSGPSLSVSVEVNDIEEYRILDTGAEVTIISESFHRENNFPQPTRKVRLLNAENDREMIGGAGLSVSIRIGTSISNWNVIVAPIRDNVLLGLDFFFYPLMQNLHPKAQCK